ncbi:hypothetical protein HZ993_12680 [Rhodoferax sp. AJA081-3]|uniref:hypothetical protein n=1 Tax=Rhodoferax sp. AJA081-3 TaxID=2752316 RepID=UPI001ADF8312|nr:hypothetical protein [Rhodoferax sp. AJA081-3]QTN26201.1 hypothetical protein HZ993_12680 [Rhodoferax sp. AJA081-3]
MKSLLVCAVEPYSPGDGADVTLRSDKAEIVVLCYPCGLVVGDTVENRLSILSGNVHSAYLSDWPEEDKVLRSHHKLERVGNYAYRGVGQVVNHAEGLVDVLGFVIDFGSVPCDGAVEFEVSRVDI